MQGYNVGQAASESIKWASFPPRGSDFRSIRFVSFSYTDPVTNTARRSCAWLRSRVLRLYLGAALLSCPKESSAQAPSDAIYLDPLTIRL